MKNMFEDKVKQILEGDDALKEGDLVVIVTKTPDEKYDNSFGSVSRINPVAGHEGYSVNMLDTNTEVTFDKNEVRKLTGSKLQSVLKRYE